MKIKKPVTSTMTSIQQKPTIDILASQINDEYEAVIGHADLSVRSAIRCGRLLWLAKEALSNEEFNRWIKTHLKLAAETVNVYLELAAHHSKLSYPDAQRIEFLSINGALRAMKEAVEKGHAGERERESIANDGVSSVGKSEGDSPATVYVDLLESISETFKFAEKTQLPSGDEYKSLLERLERLIAKAKLKKHVFCADEGEPYDLWLSAVPGQDPRRFRD